MNATSGISAHGPCGRLDGTAAAYVERAWKGHMERHGLVVTRLCQEDRKYASVLAVRKRSYAHPAMDAPCAGDRRASLYLLERDGVAAGTIRVMDAAAGPMDCEEHFPGIFRQRFPGLTGSASRFCLVPGLPAEARAARLLAEHAWADALDRGIRCDVIDVAERAIPYYRKLGYLLVDGQKFIHPLLGTQSRIMAIVAGPQAAGDLALLLGRAPVCEGARSLAAEIGRIAG